MMDHEIKDLAKYLKLVKRIYLGIIVFIIILFIFFVYTYGWDLFSHFYVAAFFILTIIIMYMLSMILLFIFRRKVRKLKDKL